jgi:hypothetical protein
MHSKSMFCKQAISQKPTAYRAGTYLAMHIVLPQT